jgi:hypothetical protein
MLAYTEDNKLYKPNDLDHVRDLTKLKFEEMRFVQGIHQLVKNLSKICHCFHHVYMIHTK